MGSALIFASCGNLTSSEGDLAETLDPVEEVSPINGAQASTMNVERGSNSYFTLEFNDIESNPIISSGFTGDGWCIDWEKPIDSNSGVYSNIPLYSTFNVEPWNPLNYLLNIKENLLESDPEITYREIQLVIWSLRGLPEFNLDSIPLEELPSRFRNNGDPTFSYDKVNEILESVENDYRDFDFVEGTRFAVIAETPSDVQTVIVVVE